MLMTRRRSTVLVFTVLAASGIAVLLAQQPAAPGGPPGRVESPW